MKKKKKKAKKEKTFEFDMDIFDLSLSRLDVHWTEQPKIVARFSKEQADAKDELRRAKGKLEAVRAELGSDIRRNPKEYDVEKPTEGAVNSTIPTCPEFIVAQNKVFKLEHLSDLLHGILKALDDRKRALEGLVYLYGQDYFSVPKLSVNGRKAVEEYNKHVARDKMKNRKKND